MTEGQQAPFAERMSQAMQQANQAITEWAERMRPAFKALTKAVSPPADKP